MVRVAPRRATNALGSARASAVVSMDGVAAVPLIVGQSANRCMANALSHS